MGAQKYFTLSGHPVIIELNWPYHPAAAGGDWFVLHGSMHRDDGSGLHADVAVHLTQTIAEALPSLEPQHAEMPSINAIRKELDVRNLEFLKSGKRQPVPLSSRYYGPRSRRFRFHEANDQQVTEFLLRKVYWLGKDGARVLLADPNDAQYLGRAVADLALLAAPLASQGMFRLDGDYAVASEALKARAAEMQQASEQALEALNAKHAYEAGRR